MSNSLASRLKATNLVAFTDGTVDVNKGGSFSNGAGTAVVVEFTPVEVSRILVSAFYMGGTEVTNNTMELCGFEQAVRESAKILEDREDRSIRVWSDSQYALGVLFNPDWRPSKNKVLIRTLKKMIKDSRLEIDASFVRAHEQSFLNNLADFASYRAMMKKSSIRHEIEFSGIDPACLFCKKFPCLDRKPLGNVSRAFQEAAWGRVFRAIKENTYSSCEALALYIEI